MKKKNKKNYWIEWSYYGLALIITFSVFNLMMGKFGQIIDSYCGSFLYALVIGMIVIKVIKS